MRELELLSDEGKLKGKIRAFELEPGDNSFDEEQSITKEGFLAILDKASQPIRSETETEKESK